jgi:hypothetical protein
MELLALLAGNALVWLAGWAAIAIVRTPRADGEVAWSVGCAWFVGAFAMTLWMRALALIGVPFGAVSVGLALVLVAAAGLYVHLRRYGRPQWSAASRALQSAVTGDGLAGWHRALWLALLAWLALRFALTLGEVLMRPLFPWDAWTQWSTKAKVWFELRTLAPFVPAADWFQPGNAAFVDAAPHYPATVPLMQVWSALLVGRWDDVLVNLPWWLSSIAFTLAVFGFCRGAGFAALPALAVTWLVASLPMMNVHVALAGYADLWMSGYLTLGVLAGLRWFDLRGRRDALIALVLLVACVTIKNPGKAWLLVLVPGLVAALLPRAGVKVALGGLAVVVVALVALARFNASLLGYRLGLEFVPPWQGLWDAWFAYANWHLLWFGAIVVPILARRHLLAPGLAPLTLVVATGLLFLFFGFAFTNAAQWVADQSTVNRATMHLAPLVAIWMVLLFRRWWESLPSGATVAMPMPENKTG